MSIIVLGALAKASRRHHRSSSHKSTSGKKEYNYDYQRYNYFYNAAANYQYKELSTMIEKGEHLDDLNEYYNGRTPIMKIMEWADHNKVLEYTKLLVESGSDISMVEVYSNEEKSLLMLAVAGGHNDTAVYLVEKGADINYVAKNNDTALILALRNNNDNIAKYLIEKGADVNWVGKDRETPLQIAVKQNNFEMVKYLVEHGAKTQDALLSAVYGKNMEIIDYLIQNGAKIDINCVIAACRQNNVELVNYLLENGNVDLNEKSANMDIMGELLLHTYHSSISTEVLQTLIDHGYDVSKNKDLLGYSIHSLYKDENVKIAKFLIDNGAKPKEGDLANAISSGCDLEFVQLMLDNGSTANDIMNNDYKLSALEMALNHDKNDIVKLLIKNGADVNYISANDQTPLSIAIASNDLEMVKLLVENGADINQQNQRGISPLMKACSLGNAEIVKYLIDCGADLSLKDINGKTAYDYSKSSKKTKRVVAKTKIREKFNICKNFFVKKFFKKKSLTNESIKIDDGQQGKE